MFGQTLRFTLLTPREVSQQVADALETGLARNSRFVGVTYDGTDGNTAARVLNTILRRFVREAAVLKAATLVEESEALDSQVIAAKQEMDARQTSLQDFKIRTATAPREGPTGLSLTPGLQMTGMAAYGEFFGLRLLADSLKRERQELGEAMARVQSGELPVDQMLAIGAVAGSQELGQVLGEIARAEAEVRQLRVQYGPEWRPLIDKQLELSTLRESTLPSRVASLIARMDRDIATTETRIASASREMRDIPARTITEQELTYNYELAQKTHELVKGRAEQARLQSASSLPDVRVLNEAVAPLQPTRNRKSVILVLSVIAGLGVGLGLAFLLDLGDKRFRYADQITSGLGLSILGVVPEIRRAKGKAASAEEAAQVVEAFRTIRLNLSHVFPESGSIALTVTSPMPGDGKSLVSSNLALSFAEAGYRTLLIDGDTRRGELHRTFGTDRRPGLLDHLAAEVPVDQILRNTSHGKLTLMPAGSRHRNAPELMGSRRMHELMAAMRKQYEVIIVDSPPLAAGIDPFVLGTITGNLLMVVRAGATERDLAEAKLQIIDRLPIRLVGAVLNDVRASMDEYKYYAYSYGYGTTEEDEELAALPATTVHATK
jgi:capsular exopolysaccharide synthesis family protein